MADPLKYADAECEYSASDSGTSSPVATSSKQRIDEHDRCMLRLSCDSYILDPTTPIALSNSPSKPLTDPEPGPLIKLKCTAQMTADRTTEPMVSPPSELDESPNPLFEGVEKILTVNFAPGANLRALPRRFWDALTCAADCAILSAVSNEHRDAYLLSESSLFVADTQFVLKTCGTTKPLLALDLVLPGRPVPEDAAKPNARQRRDALGTSSGNCAPSEEIPELEPAATELLRLSGARCTAVKYSRHDYELSPQWQCDCHRSFQAEAAFLDAVLSASKIEDLAHGARASYGPYSVYTAGAVIASPNLECNLFELDRSKMEQFWRRPQLGSPKDDGEATIAQSGIAKIWADVVPRSTHSDPCGTHTVDSFMFDPCGLSVNGLRGDCFWSMHISPEDANSYVSFEVSNSDPEQHIAIIRTLRNVFGPGRLDSLASPAAAGEQYRVGLV